MGMEASGLGPCQFCGAVVHDPALVRQATSGRPYQRMVAQLKREGLHICWICGVDIDMTLPHNDKWSWTLDHYFPKALYPCLGLDSSNHREAHRTCNSAKGVGTAPRTTRTRNSRDW
jgi:5-methylcytosine-specific restriction endonuclease McrA